MVIKASKHFHDQKHPCNPVAVFKEQEIKLVKSHEVLSESVFAVLVLSTPDLSTMGESEWLERRLSVQQTCLICKKSKQAKRKSKKLASKRHHILVVSRLQRAAAQI